MKEKVLKSPFDGNVEQWIRLTIFSGIVLLILEEITSTPVEFWQDIAMRQASDYVRDMTEKEILELIQNG